MAGTRRWTVGVDWARRGHQVCLLDLDGGRSRQRRFDSSGRGLHALVGWLIERTAAAPGELPIAIERSDGPLVELLLDRGFAVFSINPKQADRFRDRFSPSGAKDDRRDALVLASALGSDRRAFRRLAPPDPQLLALRLTTRERARVQEERRRLGQRVREHLLACWPEMEAILTAGDATAVWFMELWQRIPTPERARRTRLSTLERFLKQRRFRRFSAAALHRRLTRQTVPVSVVTTAHQVAAIRRLLRRLRPLHRDLAALDRDCARQLAALKLGGRAGGPELVEQLCSFPGVGPTVAATLLGEAGELVAAGDYRRLRALSGVAPVIRSSGQHRAVRRRRAANVRLRNAMFYRARTAAVHDPAASAYYQRRRRTDHWTTALRKLADRQLRILAAVIRNGTLYDPARAMPAAA